MKLNKGYWHTVEIELKSNPDYMDVVQDYLKKNDLKDLPVPEGTGSAWEIPISQRKVVFFTANIFDTPQPKSCYCTVWPE